MKANEAPERIWIDPATDLPKLSGHIDKDSIEYIRIDAFIEKAWEYLMEYEFNDSPTIADRRKRVESFPTNTLVDGNFEDKVIVKLLIRFYKVL